MVCLRLLSLISCLVLLAAVPSSAAADPNILLIVADDLGYGELFGDSAAGRVPTPHLDALAASGVRCTQAYVSAPNCSPSRAGLLTGRIPLRFGYEFNPIGARNVAPEVGLPPAETTIAELLRARGYATGLIGKWHLGGHARYHPQRHGFDEFFGFLHEGHFYVPPSDAGVTTMLRRRALPGGDKGLRKIGGVFYSTHMGHDEPPYDANNPILRSGQPVAEPTYLSDAFTREAVDFIRRHRDQPFFLCVTYNAVHSPLQAADRYVEKFAHIANPRRRIFAAMLANLDDGVGALADALRGAEIVDNTLVVFLSDNGGPTRELTSSNLPLRGGKSDMYEGGIRVPCIVSWPGVLPAGREHNAFIAATDFFATFAALAGAPPSDNPDSVDLMPYLRGDKPGPTHREYFWRQGKRGAARTGDWKLVVFRDPTAAGGIRWELYNIADDPTESHELSMSHPDKLRELQDTWREWNQRAREPLFR